MQVRVFRDVDNRCSRHLSVLHLTWDNGQQGGERGFRYATGLPGFPHLQVLAALGGIEDSGVHAAELRERAGVPVVLADDGDHYICDGDVLRREERAADRLQEHSRGVLVHDRHDDHARVSLVRF